MVLHGKKCLQQVANLGNYAIKRSKLDKENVEERMNQATVFFSMRNIDFPYQKLNGDI
jgi:hypothetical protein